MVQRGGPQQKHWELGTAQGGSKERDNTVSDRAFNKMGNRQSGRQVTLWSREGAGKLK